MAVTSDSLNPLRDMKCVKTMPILLAPLSPLRDVIHAVNGSRRREEDVISGRICVRRIEAALRASKMRPSS